MLSKKSDCIFCKIVRKELPAKVRLESDDVIAFDSIDPVSEHHLLIVPKKHIESLLDINENNNTLSFSMISVAQELINKLKINKGYKLVINGGIYQSVPHLHWHLLAGNLEAKDDILNKT